MVEKSTPFWVMDWASAGTCAMGMPVLRLMVEVVVVLVLVGVLDFNRTPSVTPKITIKTTSPITITLEEVLQPSFTGFATDCGPITVDSLDPQCSQNLALSSFSWPQFVHFTI
jgi:hypothetical protein